jgi:hypothetical protein
MSHGLKNYGGDKRIRRADGRVCSIWKRSTISGTYLTACNQWAEGRDLTVEPSNCTNCTKKET